MEPLCLTPRHLVRFFSGWERDGNGPDGLPLFRETIRVRMDRPPYLSIEREAEEDDITDHPGPYELYKKTCEARKDHRRLSAGAVARLSSAYFPDVRRARHPHCRAAGADWSPRSAAAEAVKTMPPDVIELADRAVKMIELHGKAGQYEELVTDLQGQLEAMKEQFTEAVSTISAQKTLIETLRLKACR